MNDKQNTIEGRFQYQDGKIKDLDKDEEISVEEMKRRLKKA